MNGDYIIPLKASLHLSKISWCLQNVEFPTASGLAVGQYPQKGEPSIDMAAFALPVFSIKSPALQVRSGPGTSEQEEQSTKRQDYSGIRECSGKGGAADAEV